jgi:hypothetical protein
MIWFSPLWWLFGIPFGFWFGPAPLVQAPVSLGLLVTYALVTLGMALFARAALER